MAIFLSNQLDQILSQGIEQGLRSADGFSSAVYAWGLLSLFGSLIFPVLFTLLCLFGLTESEKPFRAVGSFLKKHFFQTLIETLRAWGKILQWCFALLVPGAVKYVHFTLVPFVVSLSRVYDRGEADALELSSSLVKKYLWRVLGIVLLFHLFLPLFLTALLDDYRNTLQTPVASISLSLLDAYFYLLAVQCLWGVYKLSSEGSP